MNRPEPRFGALEPPEPDSKVELEVHVDARYISDGIRVGVADAGVHLHAVDNVAGAVRHGFGRGELGAAVMATTTALAETTRRPDRTSRYFASR
jgi:hypothetical protein